MGVEGRVGIALSLSAAERVSEFLVSGGFKLRESV